MTKIALMGSAPSSRLLGPFNDMDWEIWSCSPPNYDLPRVDAWFEFHNLDRKWGHAANAPYVRAIQNHPRVYIAKADPRLPNAIVFPFDPLIEKYGRDFWASSLSWMMAFAIEQKPEKIGIWGVDLAAAEEYGQQRPSFKFFIREAKKLGIGIYAPSQSDILLPMPLYGLKEHSPMWIKQRARKQELEQRLANARAQVEKNEKEMLIFQGALDDLHYIENTYCPAAFKDGLDGKDEN